MTLYNNLYSPSEDLIKWEFRSYGRPCDLNCSTQTVSFFFF